MATSRPKRFEYAVELDADGTMRADGEQPVSLADEWSPDHLLLAALVSCVIMSLEHYAGKAGIEVVASGSARGVVTKRETDGRYAFVEIDVDLRASLSPQPDPDAAEELLRRAERGCFVGSSLTVEPTYDWTFA
jgi:organic hydroperoxide reductase OsmC/OhrA